MIVIPDLFGSYQRGREEAIKNNWNDLTQYESIESARHQNDAQALANLATMADFGKKRQMTSNDAATSDLNLQLLAAQQPAKLNIAKGDEIYTGVQLDTMVNNMDLLTGGLANQFGTWYYGTGTANNNAKVANDKSTIGRLVMDYRYPEYLQLAFDRSGADIAVGKTEARWRPFIAERQYATQGMQADTGLKTATVDNKFAIPAATSRNEAAIAGNQASKSGSELAYLTSTGEIVKLPYTFTDNANSAILKLQEQQKGLDPNSGEYKTLQGAIDNILNGNTEVMKALGYNGISASYFAPTPPSAATQGTGSTTYVDPSTGRAITVPYATTGVGPLASGYVTYGSNGTNLFTGSSQPRTLSEITANLTTPRQNVMGVPNLGNVPNSALVKPAKATVRHYLPNGQVLYTNK